jgi:hypothetical protein
MTQILNLTLLAPDIQEALLFLPLVEEGKPEASEKGLRKVCGEADWGRQRELIQMTEKCHNRVASP